MARDTRPRQPCAQCERSIILPMGFPIGELRNCDACAFPSSLHEPTFRAVMRMRMGDGDPNDDGKS